MAWEKRRKEEFGIGSWKEEWMSGVKRRMARKAREDK